MKEESYLEQVQGFFRSYGQIGTEIHSAFNMLLQRIYLLELRIEAVSGRVEAIGKEISKGIENL